MSTFIDQLKPLVLNVGLAVHNADWNWKNVSSPFTRIYYVTEGEAQVTLYGKTQILSSGNLYYIPAFTVHNYSCNSSFAHYYLHLYEDHESGINLLDSWNFPIEVPGTELDLILIQRLCAVNPHMSLPKSDPASYDNILILRQNLLRNKMRAMCDRVESRGIVYQLLAHFLKRAVKKTNLRDSRIEKAVSHINIHICDTINLDDLAGEACLSKDHFIRLFKKETGITPLKYINQKKIERAQLILVTDDMPVKNVAMSLSFDDYSYFNRLFKKMTGVTPQEYRSSIY